MPSVVIGGGNFNAGLRHLDEVHRRRQEMLAQQQQEQDAQFRSAEMAQRQQLADADRAERAARAEQERQQQQQELYQRSQQQSVQADFQRQELRQRRLSDVRSGQQSSEQMALQMRSQMLAGEQFEKTRQDKIEDRDYGRNWDKEQALQRRQDGLENQSYSRGRDSRQDARESRQDTLVEQREKRIMEDADANRAAQVQSRKDALELQRLANSERIQQQGETLSTRRDQMDASQIQTEYARKIRAAQGKLEKAESLGIDTEPYQEAVDALEAEVAAKLESVNGRSVTRTQDYMGRQRDNLNASAETAETSRDYLDRTGQADEIDQMLKARAVGLGGGAPTPSPAPAPAPADPLSQYDEAGGNRPPLAIDEIKGTSTPEARERYAGNRAEVRAAIEARDRSGLESAYTAYEQEIRDVNAGGRVYTDPEGVRENMKLLEARRKALIAADKPAPAAPPAPKKDPLAEAKRKQLEEAKARRDEESQMRKDAMADLKTQRENQAVAAIAKEAASGKPMEGVRAALEREAKARGWDAEKKAAALEEITQMHPTSRILDKYETTRLAGLPIEDKWNFLTDEIEGLKGARTFSARQRQTFLSAHPEMAKQVAEAKGAEKARLYDKLDAEIFAEFNAQEKEFAKQKVDRKHLIAELEAKRKAIEEQMKQMPPVWGKPKTEAPKESERGLASSIGAEMSSPESGAETTFGGFLRGAAQTAFGPLTNTVKIK